MPNTTAIKPLSAKLTALHRSGTFSQERAEALVRHWISQHMPELPKPTVTTRAFTVDGRLYVRCSITVQPMCMDVLVSQESAGA